MSTNSTDRNRAEESVDIVDIVDGVDRPGDAAHASDQACARLWRVEWPEIEPALIEYQEPVTFERVLSEHRAAVAACPVKVGPPPSRVLAWLIRPQVIGTPMSDCS